MFKNKIGGFTLHVLACLLGAMALMTAGTASAQNFSDPTFSSFTSRAAGSSTGAHITVSAPYPVTRISTVSQIGFAHNQKFVIYNLTTTTMLYVSPPKAFPLDGAPTLKASDPFAAVTLLPGNVYLIGSISDQPGNWYFNFGSNVTQGVVTSTSTNGNFNTYAAPAFDSCCFGVRPSLEMVSTPPATIPTMGEWAMILFGLVLAGGTAVYLNRRRLAA